MADIPLTISLKVLNDQFRESIAQNRSDIHNLSNDFEDLGKRIDDEMNKAGVTMSAFTKSSEQIGTTLESSYQGLNEALGRTANSLGSLEDFLARIKTRESELIDVRAQNTTEIQKLNAQIKELSEYDIPAYQFVGDTESLQKAEEKLNELKDQIDDLKHENISIGIEIDNIQNARSKAEELTSTLERQQDRLLELKDAYKGTNASYEKSISLHSVMRNQLKMVQAEMDEMIREAVKSGDSEQERSIKTSEAYKKLQEQAKSLKDSIASITGRQATSEFTTMTRSISQMVGVFKTSKNPIVWFRTALAALRGGVSLSTISFKSLTTAIKTMGKALLSNPIGLIIAGLAALVAVISKVISSIKSQAEKQIELNKQQEIHLDLLKKETDMNNQVHNENIKNLERELSVLNEGNARLEEKYELEDKIYEEQKKNAEENLEKWAEQAASVEDNRKKLEKYNIAIAGLKKIEDGAYVYPVKSSLYNRGVGMTLGAWSGKPKSITIDGITYKGNTKELKEALEGVAKNLETEIEIGVDVKTNMADIEADGKRIAERRKKDAEKLADDQLSAQRAVNNSRISLINDSYTREINAAKEASRQKIEDLEKRLKKEHDLEIRNALTEQRKLEEEKLQKELTQIAIKHSIKRMTLQRQIEDTRQSSAPMTSEEQQEQLKRDYDRRKEDVTNQIRSGVADGTLSAEEVRLLKQLRIELDYQYEKEREILNKKIAQEAVNAEREAISLRLAAVKAGTEEEYRLRLEAIEKERKAAILANSLLPEDQRQSEADINAKYNRQQKDYIQGLIENYTTYEEKRLKITEEYANKRKVLEEAANAAGQDVDYEQLNKEEEEALAAVDTEVAMRQSTFRRWLYSIGNSTLSQLRSLLVQAQEHLKLLEATENVSDNELAEARAQVAALLNQIEELEGEISPEKESIEKWESLAVQIDNATASLNALGDAADETMGKFVKHVASIMTGINSVIKNVTTLGTSMIDLGDKAGKAIKAATSASGILAIIEAIYTLITAIRDAIDELGGEGSVVSDLLHWLTDSETMLEQAMWALLGPIGTIVGFINSDNKYSDREAQKRLEEMREGGKEALKNMSELLAKQLSTLQSIDNTIGSLNLKDFKSTLLTAINDLNEYKDLNWYWGSTDNSWDYIRKTVQDYDHVISNLSDDNIKRAFNALNITQSSKAWDDYQDALNAGTADAMREFFKNTNAGKTALAYYWAGQQNYERDQLDKRRDELLAELNALYEKDSIDPLEYYTTVYKLYQYQLERLEEQMQEALGQNNADAAAKFENQMREVELSINDSMSNLVSSFAGADITSIIQNWADIFQKFGTDVRSATSEINGSIDDMIINFVRQRYFIQPLFNKMKDMFSGLELGSDEADYEKIGETIASVRDEVGTAAEYWNNVLETLKEQYDIDVDSNNQRSGSSKGIAQASQDSIDELNGRMTAIQGHTYNINDNLRIVRDSVDVINSNVAIIRDNTQHLNRMDNDLHSIATTLNDLQSQGMRIR